MVHVVFLWDDFRRSSSADFSWSADRVSTFLTASLALRADESNSGDFVGDLLSPHRCRGSPQSNSRGGVP